MLGGNVFPAGTGLLLEKNDMAGFSYEIKGMMH